MKKIKKANLESDNQQLLLNSPYKCDTLIIHSLKVKFQVKRKKNFNSKPTWITFSAKRSLPGFQIVKGTPRLSGRLNIPRQQ